jgi:ABC-type Fe3+-hydroxamate transport system substrate-binding protein
MKKTIIFIILIIALTVFCNRNSSDTDSTNTIDNNIDGETLLKDRCTQCHPLDRVYNKAYTREEWTEVIEDMIDKGAKLNDEEKEILIEDLTLD